MQEVDMTIQMSKQRKRQAQAYTQQALLNRTWEQQFGNDADMWLWHIDRPNHEQTSSMVKNIFKTLHYGGLQYRPSRQVSAWRFFGSQPWPTAAALSHGGRVLIQLPMANPDSHAFDGNTGHDDEFWNWLTCGVGGRRAMGIEWRVATHGVSILENPEVLCGGVVKQLKEEKGKGQSLAPRNVEFRWLGFGGVVAEHHRHWGVDLALGGLGRPRMTGIGTVDGDGSDGHMYLYYMAPKIDRYGGILIGVEGSRAGEYDQFGHKHSWKATSSSVSPTGGLKWRHLGMGPVDAHDDLFVDISRRRQMYHVMVQMYQPSCVTQPPNSIPGFIPPNVTFIPDLNTFKNSKKWTYVLGRRRSPDGITVVDNAVEAYLRGLQYPNRQARQQAVRNLFQVASQYARTHVNHPRTRGVKKLIQCLASEFNR